MTSNQDESNRSNENVDANAEAAEQAADKKAGARKILIGSQRDAADPDMGLSLIHI